MTIFSNVCTTPPTRSISETKERLVVSVLFALQDLRDLGELMNPWERTKLRESEALIHQLLGDDDA